MKKSNILFALTSNVHTDDAPEVYSQIINALTSVACAEVMNHLWNVRKGLTDTPDLDTRNMQDEDARGNEANDVISEMAGHEVRMSSLKAAQILDAIRFTLYSDMHAWGEFDNEQALYFTPPASITARPNYNQPMSAELYMQYRIDNAVKLNETEIAMAVKRMNSPNVTEAIVRQAMMEEALRMQRTLKEMKPLVLSEMNSFEDVYDIDAFTSLDITLQCKVATKISEKIDRHFMRLLPKAVRSLDMASKLEAVERRHALVKQWLAENDAELQAALLLRAA